MPRARDLCLVIPAVFLIATSAGAADAPRACSVVEQHLAVGVIAGGSSSIRMAGGSVAEVIFHAPDGTDSVAELTQLRPGLSFRQILEPQPGSAGPYRTVFNLVALEAGGTVLAETWLRFAGLPDSPRYTWTRLRCSAS
ncbi:MAG: hypothetical protein JWO26_744 [Rhodospirillales bacterium]|jgi:hypothetical protein|nr:hypothetical protein [Rhodospirillales bacterium]